MSLPLMERDPLVDTLEDLLTDTEERVPGGILATDCTEAYEAPALIVSAVGAMSVAVLKRALSYAAEDMAGMISTKIH